MEHNSINMQVPILHFILIWVCLALLAAILYIFKIYIVSGAIVFAGIILGIIFAAYNASIKKV